MLKNKIINIFKSLINVNFIRPHVLRFNVCKTLILKFYELNYSCGNYLHSTISSDSWMPKSSKALWHTKNFAFLDAKNLILSYVSPVKFFFKNNFGALWVETTAILAVFIFFNRLELMLRQYWAFLNRHLQDEKQHYSS